MVNDSAIFKLYHCHLQAIMQANRKLLKNRKKLFFVRTVNDMLLGSNIMWGFCLASCRTGEPVSRKTLFVAGQCHIVPNSECNFRPFNGFKVSCNSCKSRKVLAASRDIKPTRIYMYSTTGFFSFVIKTTIVSKIKKEYWRSKFSIFSLPSRMN